jgi:hypothetical protein
MGRKLAARNDLVAVDGFSPTKTFWENPLLEGAEVLSEPRWMSFFIEEVLDDADLARRSGRGGARLRQHLVAKYSGGEGFQVGAWPLLVAARARVHEARKAAPGRGRVRGPGHVICHEPATEGGAEVARSARLRGSVVRVTIAGRLYR